VLAEFQRIIDLAEKGEWPPLEPDIVSEWYFWHLTNRGKPTVEGSVREYISVNNITLSPNTLVRLIRECQCHQAERTARSNAVDRLVERIEEGDIDPQSISLPAATGQSVRLSDHR
jgi:hypothetical protein